MPRAMVLKIKNNQKIYQELVQALVPYKERPQRSILFIVEGTKENPLIGIRYPGKKVKRRKLKVVRVNSALWANLYDFEVVPFKNRKTIDTNQFTFETLIKDFEENKKDNNEFWEMVQELYEHNTITKKAPDLPGINSQLYLLVLKWVWIQEDFNYKFSWKEVGSPIKYCLVNKSGKPTRRGAGKAKFFALLILLKYYFTFEEAKKIIPPY